MKFHAKPLPKESRPGVVALQASLIIAALICIYVPSLQGGWIGDDVWYISNNPLLLDPWRLWKAWFEPGSWVEYYPIEESVQWFQWRLWHYNTLGYHVTNVILHGFSAFLLWHLFKKFGLKLAWLGALLFVIHPEAVDSVSEMVELKNTLSLPPFVLAMCLYMDYVETKSVRCYLWAFALFVVAMLCKISMAPFPFIILLYVWWKKGEITWPDVKAAIPFFLISLALSLTTIWCGKVYSHPVENWDPGDHAVGGPLFRFILSGQIIAFYFSRFFLPINPVPIYAKWPVDPSQWINYFYWPVILVVLGFLWTKRRSWGRDALLGVGFFLISLLPFIGFNSISYMNATWILDHVLYIPMIGLIGLAVAACGKINALLPASTRPFSISILCVILALLTFQSHFYASQFLSEETITRYNLRFANSIDLHNNLGIALQDRGAYGEAIQQFQLALADEPHGGKAQFNMGTVLVKMGQMNDAIAAYEKSVDDAPEQGAARAGLADTLFQVGRTDEAMKQYQEAIRLNFKVAMMTGRVGECLFIEGRRDEALKQFKAAVEADPDLPLAQYNLAKALCQMGQVDEGIKHYRQAIQLLPNYAEAHNNLGIALFGQGHTDAALEEFRQAVQDDPNYSDARNNLELAEKGAATSR